MNKIMFALGNVILLCCSLLLVCATKDEKEKGFNAKALEKSMCCIPKGKFRFSDSTEISNYKIKARRVNIDSFYLCNHVVSNKEYMFFLDDLKNTDSLLYRKMYPDTTVWCFGKNYKVEYLNHYYFSKYYDDFPVVGVSHFQAEYYCKWLTKHYLNEPGRKFKNAVFKLPTIYQWEYAAFAGNDNSPFPWGTPYLKDSKGQLLANYTIVPEQDIKRIDDNDESGKLNVISWGWTGPAGSFNAEEITSPVISFSPNKFGLYNMSGNVSEYVSEKGITKGGSWNDPGYYLQIWVEETYPYELSVSNKMGFRVAMELGK